METKHSDLTHAYQDLNGNPGNLYRGAYNSIWKMLKGDVTFEKAAEATFNVDLIEDFESKM